MNSLHNAKGKFSLSYYDFTELKDMYPKDKFSWETKEFVKPAGATEGTEQSTGEEVLIMNYWVSSKLHDSVLDASDPHYIGRDGDKNRAEKK